VWLQVIGFAILVYATFLFNDVISINGCWSGWKFCGHFGGKSDINPALAGQDGMDLNERPKPAKSMQSRSIDFDAS
jgi:hypothetical protein